MRIHHDKHHAAYVNNLNAALEPHPDLQKKIRRGAHRQASTRCPKAIRTPVRNNGGGHVNHTMFWEMMAPGGAKEPSGALADAITKAFGGLAQFKEQFQKACVGRFGSGWGWLIADRSGALTIESTPNQDTPLMSGKRPILGCDVWEHAYYLKYQNRRPGLRHRLVERGELDRRRRAGTTARRGPDGMASPTVATGHALPAVGSVAPGLHLAVHGRHRRDALAAARAHGAAGLLSAGVHFDVHQ